MFEHPKNVCLAYTEHFKFSMYLSYKFAIASVCAIIHAIHPDMLVTHSSDTIIELLEEMNNIGCRED